jgi:hypothetical protein
LGPQALNLQHLQWLLQPLVEPSIAQMCAAALLLLLLLLLLQDPPDVLQGPWGT